MKEITIRFSEPIHHTCLMYGLRLSLTKWPNLNKRVINVGGEQKILNNIVSPPPIPKEPRERVRDSKLRHIVEVTYWREEITVTYASNLCCDEEITSFTKNLIEEYMHYRHPFTAVVFECDKAIDKSNGTPIAEIG